MILEITWLADEMNSVELLPDHIYRAVIDPRSMLSDDQKRDSMRLQLERLVDHNPHHLYEFVGILKNKPKYYEDICKQLSE